MGLRPRVFPLLLVLFLTYRWSMERIEQAENHVEVMSRTFLATIEALAMAIDAKDEVRTATSGACRCTRSAWRGRSA